MFGNEVVAVVLIVVVAVNSLMQSSEAEYKCSAVWCHVIRVMQMQLQL